jgi:hypothetical protein
LKTLKDPEAEEPPPEEEEDALKSLRTFGTTRVGRIGREEEQFLKACAGVVEQEVTTEESNENVHIAEVHGEEEQEAIAAAAAAALSFSSTPKIVLLFAIFFNLLHSNPFQLEFLWVSNPFLMSLI